MNDMAVPFDEPSFWAKLAGHARAAGRRVVIEALTLFHCMLDSDTPALARARIVVALAYFVCPIDLIPDHIPFIGYSDDMVALMAAIRSVVSHIKKEHRERARSNLSRWFG